MTPHRSDRTVSPAGHPVDNGDSGWKFRPLPIDRGRVGLKLMRSSGSENAPTMKLSGMLIRCHHIPFHSQLMRTSCKRFCLAIQMKALNKSCLVRAETKHIYVDFLSHVVIGFTSSFLPQQIRAKNLFTLNSTQLLYQRQCIHSLSPLSQSIPRSLKHK